MNAAIFRVSSQTRAVRRLQLRRSRSSRRARRAVRRHLDRTTGDVMSSSFSSTFGCRAGPELERHGRRARLEPRDGSTSGASNHVAADAVADDARRAPPRRCSSPRPSRCPRPGSAASGGEELIHWASRIAIDGLSASGSLKSFFSLAHRALRLRVAGGPGEGQLVLRQRLLVVRPGVLDADLAQRGTAFAASASPSRRSSPAPALSLVRMASALPGRVDPPPRDPRDVECRLPRTAGHVPRATAKSSVSFPRQSAYASPRTDPGLRPIDRQVADRAPATMRRPSCRRCR